MHLLTHQHFVSRSSDLPPLAAGDVSKRTINIYHVLYTCRLNTCVFHCNKSIHSVYRLIVVHSLLLKDNYQSTKLHTTLETIMLDIGPDTAHHNTAGLLHVKLYTRAS